MSRRLAHAPAEPTPPSDLQRQQIWLSQTGGVILSDGERYADFGPEEQMRALHPAGCDGRAAGTVTFARSTKDGWKEWTARTSVAPQQAKDLLALPDAVDLFVSHQRFRGRRKSDLLLGLGCLYTDLDYHALDQWRGASAQTVLRTALNALQEKRLPLPSYALDTGRGLLLVWLHTFLPEGARSRWAAVERLLVEALAEFGADPKATDVARVFRVVGSVNSKADPVRQRVGMIWSRGEPASPARYDFDDLANEVLPFTRAELVALRAERVLRRQAREREPARESTGSRRLTQASWGDRLLADLEALRYHRYPDGRIPSGHRDIWLLLAAVAISWTCPPEALEATLERLAAAAGGWTSSEMKSRMHAVLTRSRRAASGETVTYRGKEVDPRYRYTSKRMIDLLGITAAEQDAAGLRLLVDSAAKKALAAERTRKSRDRRRIKPSHAEAREARLIVGQKALYLAAKWGATRDELAAMLGVSTGLLSKAMNEAREARQRAA